MEVNIEACDSDHSLKLCLIRHDHALSLRERESLLGLCNRRHARGRRNLGEGNSCKYAEQDKRRRNLHLDLLWMSIAYQVLPLVTTACHAFLMSKSRTECAILLLNVLPWNSRPEKGETCWLRKMQRELITINRHGGSDVPGLAQSFRSAPKMTGKREVKHSTVVIAL